MNAFLVFATVLAAANAAPSVSITPVGHGLPTLVRAPAHDSASIESHRLGGNFAYATAEAHAYARVTPQISRATFPVAETTYVQEHETIANVVPAPIVNTHHQAHPILAQQAILAKQAVIGPVAQHTQVHQPIYRSQEVITHQPAPVVEVAHQAFAAPIAHHGYAAGPIAHGYAADPIAHGYAAGPIAHGLAAGPIAHGYAAGPVAQGYAPAPLGYQGFAGAAYAPQGLAGVAALH